MKIPVSDSRSVSALLDEPKRVRAATTLAHGAGAGMKHEFMERLTEALVRQGIAVLRFQFPYMDAGKRRPDAPAVATQTVAAAVRVLHGKFPKKPLLASGKSFGARMSTTAAAKGLLDGIDGIVCFGFPLHPPKEPATERADHLAEVRVPTLFLQGTRDELAELALMRKACAKLELARLHEVREADHGFDVLKRSGRTPEEVLDELAAETARFLQSVSS